MARACAHTRTHTQREYKHTQIKLQCAPVCCRMLHRVAVCYILQMLSLRICLADMPLNLCVGKECCSMLQCVLVCCSMLQYVLAYSGILQHLTLQMCHQFFALNKYLAVCCSVAVWCSVLQYNAVFCSTSACRCTINTLRWAPLKNLNWWAIRKVVRAFSPLLLARTDVFSGGSYSQDYSKGCQNQWPLLSASQCEWLLFVPFVRTTTSLFRSRFVDACAWKGGC